MKTLKRILAATTLLVTLGFASEANAQVPLENFFKNPEKAGYQISPDGKYFSYMAPYENRLNLFVQEVGSDKATRINFRNGTGSCRKHVGKRSSDTLYKRYCRR